MSIKKNKKTRLSAGAIKYNLVGEFSNLKIFIHDEVTSTNTLAREYRMKNKSLPALFIARKQTKGKGRQGRSFYSSLEEGLYFTLIISPKVVKQNDLSMYTIMIGAALIQTMQTVFGRAIQVKWVNDLFYKNRKIIGILSETIIDPTKNKIDSIILGVGINFAGSFDKSDEQTQKVAGTLFEELPDDFDINKFLNKFLSIFLTYHENMEKRTFLSIYRENLLGLGKEIYFYENNKKYHGRIYGINNTGNLLIQLSNQTIKTLYGQEIHFSSKQFVD